jgi:hypothetical protein
LHVRRLHHGQWIASRYRDLQAAAGGRKIKASYAPDKFDYEAEATSSMPDGQSIKVTMTISGRRTGGSTPDRKANLPK